MLTWGWTLSGCSQKQNCGQWSVRALSSAGPRGGHGVQTVRGLSRRVSGRQKDIRAVLAEARSPPNLLSALKTPATAASACAGGGFVHG